MTQWLRIFIVIWFLRKIICMHLGNTYTVSLWPHCLTWPWVGLARLITAIVSPCTQLPCCMWNTLSLCFYSLPLHLLSLLWWSLSLGSVCEIGIKFRAEHSIISYTPHTEKPCISALVFTYYTHRERKPTLIGVERDVIIYRYNNKPLGVDLIQWQSRKITVLSSPLGVRTYVATGSWLWYQHQACASTLWNGP